MICRVPECYNKVYGNQDVCNKHYKQLLYHGKIRERTQHTLNSWERTEQGYLFSLYFRGGGERPEKFLIDHESFEKVRYHKWCYQGRYVKNKNLGLLHRFLLGYPDDPIDHINGDCLDYRIQNLRICRHKDNIRNSKLSKNNKTGFVGVCVYHYDKMRYEAYIHVDRKKIGLGIHETAEEAARAYNEAAVKYFGEFARLNKIPEEL
jgi:hypothetical protein